MGKALGQAIDVDWEKLKDFMHKDFRSKSWTDVEMNKDVIMEMKKDFRFSPIISQLVFKMMTNGFYWCSDFSRIRFQEGIN